MTCERVGSFILDLNLGFDLGCFVRVLGVGRFGMLWATWGTFSGLFVLVIDAITKASSSGGVAGVGGGLGRFASILRVLGVFLACSRKPFPGWALV